ncbi:GILT-like protein 1 [Ischnura elegans]|uniref:GILT-like protein 1 n=1 Tax=Ischnura elegans TaxID=197161 RepID=UPI001ED8B2EA|nr:GILT-like protein 1 [Ischnura elegans]
MSYLSIYRVRLLVLAVVCLVLWKSFSYFSEINNEASHGKSEITSVKINILTVKVTVFYEALCPDSRNFFIRQLLPSFERAPHLLDVVLVPYGKAKTQLLPGEGGDEGVLHFSCQHGPVECHANKVHACAIKHVINQDDLLKYVTCMISDNMNPDEVGEKCALDLGINWEPIRTCASSLEGDLLLRKHGEDTHGLRPHVSFIPTVTLDDSQDNQAAILKDLFKEICKKIEAFHPAECG